MAILESDIKLLASAVMADTPDGGGAMTGIEIVDGQSNNLFPDTSAMDRAIGRWSVRKVFGAAHTDNVDSMLGVHAIITDAPDDPLVHCTLMQTPGWADTRATAQELVERYVVKSSRITPRMLDTHYAGSLQLRLISPASNADWPIGGDALALVAPDGHEQYVRVLRASFSTQTFYVSEGNGIVEFLGFIGTYDLGSELNHDFPGPPVSRVAPANDAAYTQIYNTARAAGSKFYGIKPLTQDASLGDLFAVVSGIYAPLVPAATVETPIIDQYPLTGRQSLASTGASSVAMPPISLRLAAGSVVTACAPMVPGSVAIQHNGYGFTDDGAGTLLQGTLAVGAVDYIGKRITLGASAPDYGTAYCALTFRPASAVGASSHSALLPITLANQGRSFVADLEPPPAPGSVTLNYMAQDRWYDLTDNLVGKLSGSGSGYGTGTINHSTGSLAATLGALPDVGSAILLTWGDASSAQAVPPASLPTALSMYIDLPDGAASGGITASWQRAGTNYTATTNASGVLSGNATGHVEGRVLVFTPAVFPDGDVTLTYSVAPVTTGVVALGSGDYQLQGALPIVPGTFAASVLATYPAGAVYPDSPLPLYDAAGVVYLRYRGASYACGTLNYATGVAHVNATASLQMWLRAAVALTPGAWIKSDSLKGNFAAADITLGAPITGVSAASGTAAAEPLVLAGGPWVAKALTGGAPLLTSGAAFSLGTERYSAMGGTLGRGWSIATGLAASAAGTVSSNGTVAVLASALPAGGANAVTWHNIAQDNAMRQVSGGVFRTASAPLKAGVFQLQTPTTGAGSGSDGGVLAGGGFTGAADYQRGIVTWQNTEPVNPADLSYNAVFLQYLPLSGALLGIETARLPLDGRVPIYRPGDLQVIHNTQTFTLPNPLDKGTVYDLGRVRLAAIKVKTQTGATVDSTLYTHDLDAGTLVFPVESDLTGLVQPFAIDHRIEDMRVCSVADIGGKLTFTAALTHHYPADSSYVSSALAIGDVFARAHGFFEQATWTGAWSDTLIGAAPLANFNEVAAPIVVTNRGAIAERWAIIFTSSTTFRVIGQTVGEIGTGTINADCAPINPATSAPYFTLPALGWGSGWAPGNVYRFNTAACGAPIWVSRTVLQGPATLQSDKFALAWRGDVDRP